MRRREILTAAALAATAAALPTSRAAAAPTTTPTREPVVKPGGSPAITGMTAVPASTQDEVRPLIWSGWQPWGPFFHPLNYVSSPAVATFADNSLAVFVVTISGATSTLRCFFQSGIGVVGPALKGPPVQMATGPAAVRLASGAIAVHVTGVDGNLWNAYVVGTGLSAGISNWFNLGGPVISAPAVTRWGQRQDVFALDPDLSLKHKWDDGLLNWSGWEPQGGVLTSLPGAVAWEPGRIDVFGRGQDFGLYHKWYAGGWSGWEPLGGNLAAGAGVSSWAPGRLDVFSVGQTPGLIHMWYQGRWSGWGENLGGNPAAPLAPGALSRGNNNIDVFATWPGSTPDRLGELWRKTWS